MTTQTDRELLELAAKAAAFGIKWAAWDGSVGPFINGSGWNPLTNDGDALRLAVKLKLQVTPGTYNSEEFTVYRAGVAEVHEHRNYLQDEYAATRRAIVIAAAAIGKAMK